MPSKVVEAVLRVTNQTGAGLNAAGRGFDDLASRAERASAKATAAMNRQERAAKRLAPALKGGTDALDGQQRAVDKLGRTAGIERLGTRFKEYKTQAVSSLDGIARSVDNHHVAMDQMGRGMAKTGIGVGAVFAGMAAAAISWESAWAGVTKTVDGADDALEADLRGLAKVLPSTHTEIAAVAENAGQLGISRKGLVAFTQTAIELGNTTNLSAEQASTSIAQLINIMGDSESSVGRIGSTIVDLGNKGASTETQIVEMGQRIAGSGRQIGLSTPEVLGFANAIASTGIEAEAGGSAASQSLQKIDTAVREGGAGLETLAKVSGKTTAQFAADFRTKPQAAITDFVEGLGELQAAGGDVTGALTALGITGIRETDVLRRLASATKAAGNENNLLRDSFNVANGAFEKNTALVVEAQKRYETTASRMKIARNQIVDAGISGGQAILPVIGQAAEGVGKLADKFSSLSPEVQGFVAKSAGVGAVALLLGGGLLTAASNAAQLYTGLSNLSAKSPELAGKLGTVAKAVGVVAAAFTVMKAAGAIDSFFTGDKVKTSLGDASQAIVGIKDAADDAQPSLDKLFTFSSKDDLQFTGKYADGITGVADAMGLLGASQGKAFKFLDRASDFIGFNTQTKQLDERFTKFDASLTQFAQVGSPAAAQGFNALRKQAEANGVPLDTLINKLPEYRDSLLQAASAQEYTFKTSEELADAMGGRLPAAMLTTGEAGRKIDTDLSTARVALESLTSSNKLNATSAAAVAQSMFSVSAAAIQASNAQIGYRQAVEAASKSKGGGLSTDNTKGQQNLALLNQQAAAYQSVAQSMVLAGKSGAQVERATKGARAEFISNATAMGASGDKAAALADKYGLIPKQVRTEIEAKLKQDAAVQIETLKNLDGSVITPEIQAKLNAGDYKGALAGIKELQKKRKTEIEAKANTGKAKGDLTSAAKKREAALEAQAKNIGGASGALNKAAKKREAALEAQGKNIPGVTGQLNAAAKKRAAAIIAEASTGAASAAINALTQPRTVNISVVTTKSTRIADNDKADGGAITHTMPRFDSGGRVAGEGGPRQDNVAGIDRRTGMQTSWVSVGEFVTNARAYANNAAAVETINRNPSKRYAIQELATGGTVGKGVYDYDTIMKMVRTKDDPFVTVVKAISTLAAENKKIAPQINRKAKAEKTYERAVDSRDDKRDELAKDKARLAALKREHASKKRIAAANREVEKSQRALNKSNRDVSKASTEKRRATEAYNKVADKSKAATEELKAAQKALTDQTRQTSGSITSAYGVGSGVATGKGLLSSMLNGAKRSAQLSDLLRQLKAAGLSDDILQQIAEKGPQGGGVQLAQSILKGGKSLIAQLNGAQASLQTNADAVGYTAATGMFGPATKPVASTSTSAPLAAAAPAAQVSGVAIGAAVADAMKGLRWEAVFDGTGVAIMVRNEVGAMVSSARRI